MMRQQPTGVLAAWKKIAGYNAIAAGFRAASGSVYQWQPAVPQQFVFGWNGVRKPFCRGDQKRQS